MQSSLARVRKNYTELIIFLPLLSVYASGIPGFTVGDILLCVFFFYRIIIGLHNNSNIAIPQKMGPIVLLVIAIPLLSLLAMLGQENADIYSIMIRIVRRVFYYLSVVCVSSKWFDVDHGKKMIILVGKIGAIYLFIQYIAYYAGHIVLHGYFSFLPVYHENYTQLDYQELYQKMFRPTSFLLEPAHISRYLCIPLIFELFDKHENKKWLWALVMSAAIIASTSGTGMICVGVIWGIWLLSNIASLGRTGVIRPRNVARIAFLVCVTFIFFRTDIVQSTILRMMGSSLTDVNTAGGARFRGYLQYFQLPFFNLIVGKGYGSTPNTTLATWFSGASYILYGCGFIGFLICIYLFAKLFLNCNNIEQRVLCVVFFFLFFVDDCFMSHVSVLYFSFICIAKNQHKEQPRRAEKVEKVIV